MKYPRLAGALMCGLAPMMAQTAVDLQTQSKAVNFQNAPYTKPMKSGTLLPATCTAGDMFFLSTAAPGSNLYGCTATDTWTLETGSGTGGVTVQNEGVAAGSRPILNFSGSAGVSLAVSDTGTSMLIQPLLNTAVVPTYAAQQAGGAVYCESASGSTSTYSCGTSPVLTAYTEGLVLQWRPDVDNTGGAITLNVNGLGAVPVKLESGSMDPGPQEMIGGRLQTLWYDGAVFRSMRQSIVPGTSGEIRPACSTQIRGRLWFVAGTTGIKDSLTVCAKDDVDAFAWRTVY